MYLYIIESLQDKTHYVGISRDVGVRLKSHNGGKVKSTRKKKPWIIIYKEEHPDLKSVLIRERYLKSYTGVKEKRKIIEQFTKKVS